MIPCKKWKHPKSNLNVGDIVMVNYSNNFVDDYRIARVSKVFPDEKGLVRTVEIEFRPRNKREPARVYASKPLTKEVVHVQKLSMLQPVNEPVFDGGEYNFYDK